MGKERLVAFTDGVVAIIITIMVLELKLPQGTTLHDLLPILPVFLSYLLSFVFVAIYWNNHHHLLQLAHRVTGPILWANMHLMNAIAYTILTICLIRSEGSDSDLARAVGRDIKGKISLAIYAVGAAAAFFQPYVGIACYALVAVIWFLPDPRVERVVKGG